MGRILCVDDDQMANQFKRRLLERSGHRVDASASAEGAVELLVANAYDAVITDWRLGEDNARRVIQAAHLESKALVVVVSSFTAEAFQWAGVSADLYLDKPVDPSELVVIVDTLLRERNGPFSHAGTTEKGQP